MDIQIQKIQKEELQKDALELFFLPLQTWMPEWRLSSLEHALDGSYLTSFAAFSKKDDALLGLLLSRVLHDFSEIFFLAVRPDVHSKGIARKLMSAFLSDIEKHQVLSIALEVRVSNQIALALYDSFGFEYQGIRKGFYPPKGFETEKENAWSMKKLL